MSMLKRRLQILIDEERYARLAAHAQERGVSMAEVVRWAIDRFVQVVPLRKQQAADRILAAEPMPVPEPKELRRQIEEIRGRKG